MIELYTDGSSLGNPGPGGRAVIISRFGTERTVKGHATNVTNNQMELTAAIEGLFALIREEHPHFSFEPKTDLGGVGSGLFEDAVQEKPSHLIQEKILISTDSEYVRKGVTERLPTRIKRGRRRTKGGKIISNLQLRQTLAELLHYFPNLERKRVKGHAGDRMNELVDVLAREEAMRV